jgi:hypothetical protein
MELGGIDFPITDRFNEPSLLPIHRLMWRYHKLSERVIRNFFSHHRVSQLANRRRGQHP